MRNELRHIEEIERYLTQKMSGEELRAFEQKLKADDGLRFEVNLQQQLSTEIRVDAFKKEALAFHETFVSTSTISKSWKYFLNSLLIGGAIGLGVVLMLFINGNEKNQSSEYTSATRSSSSEAEPGLWNDSEIASSPLLASNEISTQNEKKPKESTFKTLHPSVNPRINPIAEKTPDLPEPIRNFLVPFEEHPITGNHAQTIPLKNYNVEIELPGNCFVDKNNNAIRDSIILKYRAFNDLAELAFSGISGTNEVHTH